MFNNSSIYSESWCRTVFANRNQAYGAYDLRKIMERNTLLGLLLTTTMVTGAAMFVSMKAHGGPIPPNINLLPPATEDTTVIEFTGFKPETAGPSAAEVAPPEPPATTEPETTTSEPSDLANIKIVKNVEESDKKVPTNEASTPSTNPAPAIVPSTSTATTGTNNTGGTGTGGGGKENYVVTAEVMPEFPGGEKALMRFLATNTTYPEKAKAIDMEGTVYISFIVEKNGEVSSVKVARQVFKALDDEATRVIKSLPVWKPGLQNGQPVRVQYTVPIRFKLS